MVPITPIFLFFLKLGLNTRLLAKNQKNRTTLRVSTKRPKIGYFELKISTIKINKVRQKCQFLIFFNEIFTVYAASDGEYEKIKIKNFGLHEARMGTHDPSDQSVNYRYKSMRCCTKVIYFLKRSYNGLSEKKIKWVTFCLWKPW